MTNKPTNQKRPDFNLNAILSLVGLLLGFLFIVVIYILEFPYEFQSTWGMPLIMFLTICYAIGLLNIGYIISHEINFYLANKTREIESNELSSEKYLEFKQNTEKTFRRSIQTFLYFFFSFGLFLINLACFTASKFVYPVIEIVETSILLTWGLLGLIFIRLLVMFLVQLILIIPFSIFQGDLWDSFKVVDNLQSI